MKSIHLFLLLVFIGSLSPFHSQAKKIHDKKAIKQLKTDLGFLASDALEGRRTGTEGERKAGDYIVSVYEKEHIPAYKGNYRYPFKFVYGKEIDKSSYIRINGTNLPIDKSVFALPFSDNKSVSGDAIPDVLEKGSIWVLPLYQNKDEANDAHFDWEKYAYDKSKEAAAQGATGVVFFDSYNAQYAPEFNPKSENESLAIPVVCIGYTAYQSAIGSNTNIQVDMKVAIKKTERNGTNIAAYIDNGAPYTVVLGAHYDHLGHGEDGNSLFAGKDKGIHNGADDNASGTSALLQMASWIKTKKLKHYNYLFINFSAEELGLLGSKAFVKDLNIDSAHIAYMLNMDMVGRLNDSTHALTVGGVGTSPVWGTVMKEHKKEFKMIIDSSGIGPSDHTSFYYAGIPVLFFFTGTHSDYHKPSDDADKINYKGELMVMHYMLQIVQHMDNMPKPQFTATKQSTVGRVRFKITLGIMPDYSYQDGGVRVDGVSDDRPAAKAGIKAGDVIIQLGDTKIQGMQSYMEALSRLKEGDKSNVTVLRKGQSVTMPIDFSK